MKRKILHIIQSLDRGGCEGMLLRTLPLMKKFDHKVLTLKKRGDLANDFENNGLKVDCLDGRWLNLLRKVKEFNPEIVITYLFHADFLGRIYLGIFSKYKPIPYLRTTYNFPKYKWIRFFEERTSFLVPRYLANSKSVKNFYVSKLKVKSKKITVINNGVDVRKYRFSPNVRIDLRREMNIGYGEVVLVCVANFHSNKGHKYLLESFEMLYRKKKNIWLWLVGDGEENIRLRGMVKVYDSRERIVFFGRRTDVPKILNASDIFVMPTFFEGMSNSVLEAMASCLPVVITDIEENKELIVSGKNGFLVRPKDHESLVTNLDTLIMDKRLRVKVAKEAYKKMSEFDLSSKANIFENYCSRTFVMSNN